MEPMETAFAIVAVVGHNIELFTWQESLSLSSKFAQSVWGFIPPLYHLLPLHVVVSRIFALASYTTAEVSVAKAWNSVE